MLNKDVIRFFYIQGVQALACVFGESAYFATRQYMNLTE